MFAHARVPTSDFVGLRLFIPCVFVGVVNLLTLSCPSNTFCRTGFVYKYCLNVALTWNIFFFPSKVIESFTG